MNSPKTRYPYDKFSQKKIREHRRRDCMNRELNAMKNLVINKSHRKTDGKKFEPAVILETFTELYLNIKDEIKKLEKENAELEAELGYRPEISTSIANSTTGLSEMDNTATTTSYGSDHTAFLSSSSDESTLQTLQNLPTAEEPPNHQISLSNIPIDLFQRMNPTTQPNFNPILQNQPIFQPNLLMIYQALQQQLALQQMMTNTFLPVQTMPTTSQDQLNLLLLQSMLQNSVSQ